MSIGSTNLPGISPFRRVHRLRMEAGNWTGEVVFSAASRRGLIDHNRSGSLEAFL